MCLQDKHGLDHRSSPVSSASRPRDRLGSNRGNHHTNNSREAHNNHHNNSNHTSSNSRSSDNNYSLRDWDTCRGSEGRGVSDRGDSHRDSRDRGVSECSTGDATPTSEGEGDLDTRRGDLGSTHGVVSLSAAMDRISQPQVRILMTKEKLQTNYSSLLQSLCKPLFLPSQFYHKALN